MIRVGVTTAIDRSAQASAHLSAVGVQPVVLPCIEVTAAPPARLDEARAIAAAADWVMITSPRVIAFLWPHGDFPDTRVAAVGSSTAHAVEDAGGRVDIIGDRGADALATALLKTADIGSVAVLQASNASPRAVATLERGRVSVTPVHVYHTTPIAPDPDPVDVVTFGSPSAVTGWLLSRDLDGLVVAAIGDTTGAALSRMGHTPDIVAPTPGYRTMAKAVETFLKERSSV